MALDLRAVASADPHTYDIDNPAGGYQFAVGAGLLPFVRQLAGVEGPMVVITDDRVGDLYLPSCGAVDLEIRLPAGQGRKSLRAVEHVYDTLLDADIDRSATIVSLGTSVVEDVAGFVAATYLRGVDLVHCPTGLIAMIDTSIGGKVGLDRPHGRNLVGLFKQPKAVVADVATLQTLEPREFAAGMAEVVKHGLIAGSDLIAQIEAGEWAADDNALPGALGRLQALVAQAIQVKIAIVQEDPFEDGRRAVLNLGHTFAYAIEHVTDGRVNHGEAVGIGLVAAARLSERAGVAKPGLAADVESLLAHVGAACPPARAHPSPPRCSTPCAATRSAAAAGRGSSCCATSAIPSSPTTSPPTMSWRCSTPSTLDAVEFLPQSDLRRTPRMLGLGTSSAGVRSHGGAVHRAHQRHPGARGRPSPGRRGPPRRVIPGVGVWVIGPGHGWEYSAGCRSVPGLWRRDLGAVRPRGRGRDRPVARGATGGLLRPAVAAPGVCVPSCGSVKLLAADLPELREMARYHRDLFE